MEDITLIKLGGSLITNKSKPFTVHEDVLEDVVSQLAQSIQNGHRVLIGHGSGSFAHVPAEKYQTIKGKIDSQSNYGAAVCADAATQLNRIVVSELLKQNVAAITTSPFSMFISSNREYTHGCFDIFDAAFSAGLVPVVYGDVISDSSQDYTIWSTETVLNTIALNWKSQKYKVSRVIHVGEPDGFLINNSVVPEINESNFEAMKSKVYETKGFDVTGGMLHKIEESVSLAKTGIDSYIIGGRVKNNIYNCVTNSSFVGTRVHA